MPTILGANTLSSGYDVDNSLRVDRNSGDYLTRNESQDQSDGKKITISIWFKVGAHLGTTRYFFGGHADGSYTNEIGITSNNQLNFSCVANGTNQVTTSRYFRDPSAWYHVVAVFDSTEGTSTDRIKLYINGTQETNFASSSYPSENAVTEYLKNGGVTRVGDKGSGGNNWDGYLAEIFVLDGQALTPSSFGEFDEDTPTVWKPKDCKDDLTFGNNGFYLDFKDSSNLGNDASSNASDFSANNIAAVNQSTDTCTNNFATINPLYAGLNANESIAEGNLKGLNTGNGENNYVSTIGVSSGKWYFEAKANVAGDNYATIGIVATDSLLQVNGSWLGSTSDSYFYNENGSIGTNGSASTTGLASYTDDDIIGVRVNLDDNELHFYKNGTIITNTALSITADKEYFFGGRVYSNATGWEFNFGSPPYTISSGNSDGNGYGNFEYAVPSGYYALNTKNVATYG